MSAEFTATEAERAAKPMGRTVAACHRSARIMRALFGVSALALASQSVFPVSVWFASYACLVFITCYFLMGSAGSRSRRFRNVAILVVPPVAICACLAPGEPKPRLALLAWVFMGEFWVERFSGGKLRGRGSQSLVLGMASTAWAVVITGHSRSALLWFGLRGLPSLAMMLSRITGMTLMRLMSIRAIEILIISVLLLRLERFVSRRTRLARRLSYVCIIISALLVFDPFWGLTHRAHAPVKLKGKRAGSIALYSEGMLDWDIPSPDRLGILRSGMFGLFRRSLQRYASQQGGAVSEVDSLSPAALAGVRLVVVINPTRALSPAERQTLRDFVTTGGGLLVLGDHTDICGSRAPLNAALECASIEFNFDSAICLRREWRGCLEFRVHPVTLHMEDEVDAQISVGASLDIKPPAFPVVTGRWAFGDQGDYENGGHGANMGNARHDAGEHFGEIVLVAGEEVGNGRVLVFGDTSPFQNGARFLSQRLIANAVHWVCSDDIGLTTWPPDIRPFDDIAVIDFSLNPDAARNLFTDRSVGGLVNCFYRAGVTPVPVYDSAGWPESPFGVADFPTPFVTLLGSTRTLVGESLNRLRVYAHSGGNLVVAKGYTSPEPCADLLGDLGLEIEPVPLGNGEAAAPLRHKSAWGIRYDGPPDTLVRARAFGRPTVMTRCIGNGTFTFISDGRLLLDGNLEGEFNGVPSNVEFVTALILDLRRERCDSAPKHDILAGNHTH